MYWNLLEAYNGSKLGNHRYLVGVTNLLNVLPS